MRQFPFHTKNAEYDLNFYLKYDVNLHQKR